MIVDKPVPTPRTKIGQTNKALKGYTKSFEVDKKQLDEMKGFKFVEILRMVFNKFDGDVTITKTAYFKSKTKTVINENDINLDLLDSSQEIKNKIPGWISEGSGWTINSIDNHYLNIIKYFPLTGLSYIKLLSELRNFGKGLINL